MLTNYHTHTDFCDGTNTAEEMVVQAIEMGFDALGFSGHGYTEMDGSYCIHDTEGYISEIKRLKEKYDKKIQIYLGVEEDALHYVSRSDYDYIIGSSHYLVKGGQYYHVDYGQEYFYKTLKVFDNDVLAYAKNYYERFVSYLLERKPDIIGHFDLLTKFDEFREPMFLSNQKYNEMAEQYLLKALQTQSIFEVNTGAIARGYRSAPYPALNLLHLIRKNDGKVMVTTDCHNKQHLACHIAETKAILKDVGFKYTYVLYDGQFKKDYL